jgi:hypothetical protein
VNASFAPNALRASSALSGLVVQTAVSSTSGLARNAGKWEREAQVERTLAPIKPSRILFAMKDVFPGGYVPHYCRVRARR